MEIVRQEVAIMQYLPQHPNVIALKGAYEDDNAVSTGGEFFHHFVNAQGQIFSEHKAAQVIRTIVEMVQTCHKNGVMHRDL